MSLPHILLGLLSHPASGYELQKELQQSLQHFWSVKLAQIYPTLQRMEQTGLVNSKTEPSKKGPARRVYRRTAKGKCALVEWLTDGPRVDNERRHYLAQAFFLDALNDTARAIAFFEDLKSIMIERRRVMKTIESVWKDKFGIKYPDQLPDDEFFPHMTFELGLALSSSYVAWCDRCIKRIVEREKSITM